MEKLFSLGHTVAFDWIKDRDAPPLIIQLKFQSDWANLIGTECLHGMILIKSAFDPNHFFVRASMSIHGWVQNQKLATEIEILGLIVRRTSITFQVIVDATLLKWNVCIAVFHTNVFWLCVTRKLAERDSMSTSTYICCSSFSGTPSCGVFLCTGTC